MHASAGRRDGFSLLEVLVASGLLVLGLASIAAILPAAGSRLAEATAEDRAGTLASNAVAEILNRGLAASDLFPTGSTGKACVFGPTLSTLSDPSIVPAADAVLSKRLDATRSFLLEDDLVYRMSDSSSLPINSFLAGSSVRESREGHCFAAMLTPRNPSAPVGPGSLATLSLAVFRKAGDIQTFSLTPASGSYQLSPSDESTRKRFARGCSFLLVLRSGSTPTWRRITSSWTTAAGTPGEKSFVSLADTSALPAGGFTAIGFERLMRVDERTVTLD